MKSSICLPETNSVHNLIEIFDTSYLRWLFLSFWVSWSSILDIDLWSCEETYQTSSYHREYYWIYNAHSDSMRLLMAREEKWSRHTCSKICNDADLRKFLDIVFSSKDSFSFCQKRWVPNSTQIKWLTVISRRLLMAQQNDRIITVDLTSGKLVEKRIQRSSSKLILGKVLEPIFDRIFQTDFSSLMASLFIDKNYSTPALLAPVSIHLLDWYQFSRIPG